MAEARAWGQNDDITVVTVRRTADTLVTLAFSGLATAYIVRTGRERRVEEERLRSEMESAQTVQALLLSQAMPAGSQGFTTCCCALFPPGDAPVRVANAGHPAPYLDGAEVALEAALPLGVAPTAGYAESMVAGAVFTFVSDGVIEAASPSGELLGFERTKAISSQSAAAIADTAKRWGQNDDITVVTVRRTT